MPKVYKYGASVLSDSMPTVHAQLDAATEYRRQLVEIELERRRKISESEAAHDPEVGALRQELQAIDALLEMAELDKYCCDHGLEMMPYLGLMELDRWEKFTSLGFKSHWGDFPAEGVVLRSFVEMYDGHGNRVITKLKLKDFADR